MKKRRPGLQEIADHAGVTRMTVSRFLRTPEAVSPERRDRIAAAVEALGYIPNRAPAILSRSMSHSIGVLIPSITNQVFSEVVAGIVDVTDAANYHLMISHYGYDTALEERALEGLLAYNIDGVILSESTHTAHTVRMIESAGLPVVEIMDTRSPPLQQAVGYDNVAAAREMTNALIRRGRRHIKYLALRLDARTMQREEGYIAAMTEHGLAHRTFDSTQKSSFSLGADLMAQVLAEAPETDAVFCTNDDVAVGACFECLRQGADVPGRIAIAGFHGHDITQAMSPRLASVITPRRQIGETAGRELLRRLEGKPPSAAVIDLGYTIDLAETG